MKLHNINAFFDVRAGFSCILRKFNFSRGFPNLYLHLLSMVQWTILIFSFRLHRVNRKSILTQGQTCPYSYVIRSTLPGYVIISIYQKWKTGIFHIILLRNNKKIMKAMTLEGDEDTRTKMKTAKPLKFSGPDWKCNCRKNFLACL